MAENNEPQIYRKRYQIDKKLGAGNFGTAYLVTDLKAKNEQKVIKIIRLGEMDSEQTVDSVHEAELLANLDNEYIVKFSESFLENDCLCIVTEYCEGGDLDHRLKELKKQNRSLEEDQVVEWLIQILIAVQYMHKSRILHRDLKARNVFLKSNKVKIGDFGISRILVGTMDVATTFTGTPYYMAPEVMKHDGYESKSDIWSVGCLLYEMCTYQHAFDGKGLMNVIYKIVEAKSPELPKTYSKELNDLLKKMFAKDPKYRPSATELLQTPFIIKHRERTKLTGPLENTISGKIRSKELMSLLKTPINYGDMQNQSWSIYSKDYIPDNESDIKSANKSMNELYEEPEEEEQQIIKPTNTFKLARQTMVERKHETNTRRQLVNQRVRSNAVETVQNRQMIPENPNLEPMKQSRPSADDIEEKEQAFNNRTRNPNNRTGAMNTPFRGSIDDRPITPLRNSYQQVADKFGDNDESSYNDHSPTHERESNERTLKNSRTMSASQRSTINSMSRTINPRYVADHQQQIKTIDSETKQKTSLNVSIDDNSTTLKDNPKQDAFGPLAKDLKVNTLRTKAIQLLGEKTFEKVYDYLVKQRIAQRTDPNLDDGKITQGLRAFVEKPGDCFLVDQLVFLELI